MTYKQAVSIQIKALEQIHNNAEALRDVSMQEEQYAFNYLRSLLPDVINKLQVNADIPDSFDRQVKGNYSIIVNLDSI